MAAASAIAAAPAVAATEPEEPVGPLETWVWNNGTHDLGPATSGQYQVGLNAYARDHLYGRFYVSPAGRYPVVGNMFKAFSANGGHGRLGYPVGEVTTTDSGVAYQEFQLGNLYISEHGAFPVIYPMFRVYDSRGAVESLGAPVGRERVEGDRWVQEFEGMTLTVRRDWGQDSLGVRRASTYYLKNEISSGEAHDTIAYGRSADVVLVGDWNGDGTDTLAVRRGAEFHVKNSISGGRADQIITYGRPEDSVLVGDWNGDGIDTLAVRRGAEYHVKNSISGGRADQIITYGRPDDSVLVGDWNGDGRDSFTVRRGNEYHIKDSLRDGAADLVTNYGRADDVVLVGDWDGRNRNYSRISQAVGETTAVEEAATLSRLTPGWANNSVNATAFRKSSLTTAEIDGRTMQFAAYYNPSGQLVLARRDRDEGAWEYEWTPYLGNVVDAHNSISIAVDGAGYLHVAWSHHNSPLRYARSVAPGSLELGRERLMVGSHEGVVTYPEFFRLPDGDLFFLYRDGASGNGNLVLNRYDTSRARWARLHDNLIDGQDQRSAYWQAAVDSKGRLHLSWTWRDTPDVKTNHNVLYARSVDSTGRTWEKSDGSSYAVPITYTNAEVAAVVPQASSLMNQTSMTVDDDDKPYVASYWREGSGPVQYRVVRPDFLEAEPSPEPSADPTASRAAEPSESPTVESTASPTAEPTASPTAEPTEQAGEPTDPPGPAASGWEVIDTGIRRTAFHLGGGGTKAVPIARPQILVSGVGDDATIHLVIRDAERGSKASLATRHGDAEEWEIADLTEDSLGEWEPSYDLDLWRSERELDVFVQNVTQVDGEGLEEYPPQFVYVLAVDRHLLGASAG
ncbi:BNR-4 repeat-containing protein [Georgenia sp. EYE_87]|uniref:BNR-4 repeat-containing protein n=1 Tax=Georgenia sp. EYE_87 TaxID=2853448 RepID=UPI00200590B8|nr:BNR-4 repeat-containing protein [Georgenia sp. EYE_87]MCK6211788.1 BNR-4 repeat-containing protein [Georgenia sp. EYE_87]